MIKEHLFLVLSYIITIIFEYSKHIEPIMLVKNHIKPIVYISHMLNTSLINIYMQKKNQITVLTMILQS